MMLITAGLFVLAMASAPLPDEAAPRISGANDQLLRHLIYREVYSGIVRDGHSGMRIEPLPFTKRLPSGAPDLDNWEGAGYEREVMLNDTAADPLGRKAVIAGICEPQELPCAFTIVYLFSVSKSYVATNPDLVAVRYAIMKHGARWSEGVLWGCEKDPHHFLRGAYGWVEVTDHEGRIRMNAAVEIANQLHQAALKTLEEAGLIIRR